MEYYIVRDNRRLGPFSPEHLKEEGIGPDTKVWRDGLDGWTRAGELPELDGITVGCVPPPLPDTADETEKDAGRPPMPKTWLAESIIVTLVCCLPFGVAGIVYATQVESDYIAGRYDTAARKSVKARNMLIWGVASAAACAVIYILILVVIAAGGSA